MKTDRQIDKIDEKKERKKETIGNMKRTEIICRK